MRRFAVVVSALAALMLVWTGAALAQDDPNQGDEDKVLTVDNPAVSCADPTPLAKVDGVNTATITFSASSPIDFVTVKSGAQAEVVSSSFAADNLSGSITLSQNVSNYVVWTCAAGGGAGGQPPPPPGAQPTPPPPPGGGGAGAGGGGSLGEEAGSAAQGALPFTGLPAALLGIAGLVLLLGGLGLMRSGRSNN
jgi:hypothetical protein